MGIGGTIKRGASKVGNAAKKAGKATKNAAKKTGKGAASIGQGAVSVLQEGGNRLVGLPEAGLNAIGVLPWKKLRLRIVVLAKSDGQPVLGETAEAAEKMVEEAVALADTVFRREAKVKIVKTGDRLVTVDTTPAPEAALVVRCDGGAVKDDLGEAGFYFRKRMARNAVGTIIGTGSPITAFVVDDVIGKRGCSLGPLTDYVTVDVKGISEIPRLTLAHELGHALGLPHTGGGGSVISGSSDANLMQSSGHGEKLNRRQVITIRNSRHVTFA